MSKFYIIKNHHLLKNVHYSEILEILFNTHISDNKTEDSYLKKLLACVNFGLLEKGCSKAQNSYIFDSLDEAQHYQAQYGGKISILRKQELTFIDEEDIANSPEQFNGFGSTNTYLPGDIKYKDVNEDGVINQLDQAPIGKPYVPEIVYGFGFSAGYKAFDFSVFMQGAARTSFLIEPSNISPFVNERNALNIIANNYWSENNPDPNAFWPRLSVSPVENNEKPKSASCFASSTAPGLSASFTERNTLPFTGSPGFAAA